MPSSKVYKRRRDEDEAKSRKRSRVKKQKVYHSSSEDEGSADEGGAKVFRASDAPTPLSLPQLDPADKRTKPRSILKKSTDARMLNEDDGEDEDSQLVINTAKNAASTESQDGTEDGEDDGADGRDQEEEEEEEEDGDDDDDDEEEDLVESESDTSRDPKAPQRPHKKRNDPTAFANSISKILDTKLSNSKRSDPVLSRSRSAADANEVLANGRLEAKARAQVRSEKKAISERGRVKDVLGVDDEGVDSGAIIEQEKRLKKTAQRGVVKLFNAVRAAQVKADEAMKEARSQGVVGMRQREERVNEMSKQGFLDLISSGGKAAAVTS